MNKITRSIMKKPCCDKKGAWSKKEDNKQTDYMHDNGEASWHSSPLATGLKHFGEDEEDLIIRLHFLLGDRWSLIAGRLPGRTENEVENHWNSHLREKLIKKGVIDSNNRHLLGNSPHHANTAGPTKSGTASATSSENHESLAG